MKHKLAFFKRPHCLVTLILTIVVTAGLLFVFFYQKSQIPSFSELCDSLTQTELADDGLSLHFLLKDTTSVNNALSSSSPLYSGICDTNDYNDLNSLLTTLLKIPVPKNETARLDYKICKDTLEKRVELAKYPYLSEPLSPNSGLHIEILLLLSAYPFYELSDVTQYLSLLRSFDSFTNSLISYETQKHDKGLFMSYSASKQIIDQCESLMKNSAEIPCANMTEIYELLEDPQSPLSFLTESFLRRLLPFYESKKLTEAEFLDLYHEYSLVLQNTVAPSYERLADAIWLLQDPSIPIKGLFYSPNGKEYYEAYLTLETGSSKSVSEMKRMLEETLSSEYDQLKQSVSAFLMERGDSEFCWDFPISNPSKQLEILKKMISDDFPSLLEYSEQDISCSVIPVAKGLTPYTAPAFYIQTPIDALYDQTIYINYAETTDALSLFTTLAHEGYPGHLYQHVITSFCSQKQNRSFLRSLFAYPGYQEGWAVYVEFYTYEYAKNYCDTLLQKTYIDLITSDRKVSLCLYALCDILIHDEGADYQTIHHFLADYGITSPSSTKAIYEYIVGSPTNYMKYYMGYLETLECKELAKAEWGEQYTDRSFHQFMLEFGPAPFDMIKEEIKTSSF